jgi:hypothetical protein
MTIVNNVYSIKYKEKIDNTEKTTTIEINSKDNLVDYLKENYKNCTIIDKNFIRTRNYIVQ